MFRPIMAAKITRKLSAASVEPVLRDAVVASTAGKKKVWDYIRKNDLRDKVKKPLVLR